MKDRRIQIVGRLPRDLSRRVRTVARTQKQTLNSFLIDALTHAVDRLAPTAPPKDDRR